jgi:hypothetical protein
VFPMGVMHPRPVTTTRFTSSPCGALVIVDSSEALVTLPLPPGGYFAAKVIFFFNLPGARACKIFYPKGLLAKYSIQRVYGVCKVKSPYGHRGFCWAAFIIASGVKLIRHVILLDWRGVSSFWGLTSF